jgi:peptidoglycan/LPS O-acetylase OafA/YrhL
VMALNYRDAFTSRPLHIYFDFLIRRFARLYPAYVFIGGLYVWRLAMGWGGEETLARFTAYDIVGNVLMLTGWGLSIYPLIGVAWAASAELGSYILTPFLMLGTLWRSPVWWCASVVLAAAAIYIVGSSGTGYAGPMDVVDVRSILPMVRAVAGFTFGLAIFRYADRLDAVPGRVQDLLLVLVIGCILLVALTIRNDFAIYGLFVALVALLSRDGRLATLLFSNRLMYHLGVISYSIYLLHPWFIRPTALLARRFGASEPVYTLSFAFFFCVLWLVSYLIWRFIEEPGRQLIARLLLPKRDLALSAAGSAAPPP